ncbi:MAG: hypothetical protein HRT54_20975 [Colwellia sp.]|nr:hypothetical protein [Colwellia sp.]
MYKYLIVMIFAGTGLIVNAKEVTHIFMAGDSTMSIKEIKDYPETG